MIIFNRFLRPFEFLQSSWKYIYIYMEVFEADCQNVKIVTNVKRSAED